MSLSQKMIDIVNRLEVIFQTIDGGDDYHNAIEHSSIYKKHMDYDQVDSYPAISISAMETTGSNQTDQVTYDTPLVFEVFGYIQEEDSSDSLLSTLKLAQDMEKAIYLDEDINGNVWGLSLDIGVATNDAYGIVKITIRAVLNYTIY